MSEKEAVVNKAIEEANEKLNGNIEEFYNYNYTIKAFNSSEDTIIKNKAGLNKYLEKVFERLKIDIVYDYFMSNGLLNVLDLIIYIFGGFLVFKGSVSIGTLILFSPVSYTHLRAHETGRNLVCRLLLEKKKTKYLKTKKKNKQTKKKKKSNNILTLPKHLISLHHL